MKVTVVYRVMYVTQIEPESGQSIIDACCDINVPRNKESGCIDNSLEIIAIKDVDGNIIPKRQWYEPQTPEIASEE